MIEGNCEYCGKAFRRNRGSKNGKDAGRFCSRECASAARKEENAKRKLQESPQELKLFIKYCTVCGKPFASKHAKKYCSNYCSKEAQREQERLRDKKNFIGKETKCRWCGKTFKTEFKKSKVFCSDECRKAQKISLRKVQRKLRKIRFEDNIVNIDITLEKLIERDEGICKICGLEVDCTDYQIVDGNFIVGKNYPSIDHIYPLSKGGLHEWSNVQLAHHFCNTIKGNKI